MKRFVYVLQYSYESEEIHAHTQNKLLGVFSTKLKAQMAIEKCSDFSNFKNCSIECFAINKYKVDKGEWTTGFLEVE